MTNPLKHLEGLFKNAPQTHEEQKLSEIIKGSKYEPLDVVGLAVFDSQNQFSLYLTERGLRESETDEKSDLYFQICEHRQCKKVDGLASHIDTKEFQEMLNQVPFFIQLSKKDVLVVYAFKK